MSSSARKRKGARGCAGGAEDLFASAAFSDSTSEDRDHTLHGEVSSECLQDIMDP